MDKYVFTSPPQFHSPEPPRFYSSGSLLKQNAGRQQAAHVPARPPGGTLVREHRQHSRSPQSLGAGRQGHRQHAVEVQPRRPDPARRAGNLAAGGQPGGAQHQELRQGAHHELPHVRRRPEQPHVPAARPWHPLCRKGRDRFDGGGLHSDVCRRARMGAYLLEDLSADLVFASCSVRSRRHRARDEQGPVVRVCPLFLGDDLCHRDYLRLLRPRHLGPDVHRECRHEPPRPADGAHEPPRAKRRGLDALRLRLHRRRCALDRGAP
eukprot:scaffold14720_cov65-Phaeocystis_antarctica.AAC.1